jgi:hypothetical protein
VKDSELFGSHRESVAAEKLAAAIVIRAVSVYLNTAGPPGCPELRGRFGTQIDDLIKAGD